MKKICKVTLVLFIIFSLYSCIFNVRAGTGDVWQTGKDFLDLGSNKLKEFDSAEANEVFAYIIDFLWGLGLLVVFISTVVLGIKYMLVSPNEKSRIKQATTPYLIGTIIIFGALTIWKLMIEILEGSMLGG